MIHSNPATLRETHQQVTLVHHDPTYRDHPGADPSDARLVLEGAQRRVGVVGPVSPGASWLKGTKETQRNIYRKL